MAEEQTTIKRCSTCRLGKSGDEFYRDSSKVDGLASSCKSCSAYRVKRWRTVHPERQQANDRRRYKSNRDAILADRKLERTINRDKHNEASADWVKRNPEKHAEHRRTRRARLAGVLHIPFTLEQLVQKAAYWGDRCWRCKGPWSTWDHVKPLAVGGAHILANLRPACVPCNCSKKDTWPL